MSKLTESDLENFSIEFLEKQGYTHLTPEQQRRENLAEVVLRARLKTAIDKLNPDIPAAVKEQVLREVLDLPGENLIESNRAFHQMLTDGVGVEYQKNGNTVGGTVRLVDFATPLNNDLLACSQFTVTGHNTTRRPDIVLLVTGLPLVVIELKNPANENATVKKAFTQLQNYKTDIPALFVYNGVLVASDGLDAKTGSLTADWSRFIAWKTVDGIKEDPATTPQIETLIKGMLRPDVLLDLIKQFSVFEETKKEDEKSGLTHVETIKKIATYHQYHAVNKAVESIIFKQQDYLSELHQHIILVYRQIETSKMSKGRDRTVYQRSDGAWENKRNNAGRASSVHGTQRGACDSAREMLRNQGGGELTTCGINGKIRSKDTIHPGNDPLPPRDTEH